MLDKYRDRFRSFGGHSAACGFTIDADRVGQLRDDLNRDLREACSRDPSMLEERYISDADIAPDEIDLAFAEALEMIEPCGKDNEVPVFAMKNVRIEGWRFLKEDRRMAKFVLNAENGRKIDAVIFRNAAEAYIITESGTADILCNIEINAWRDERKAQAIVRKVLPAGTL